MIKLLSVITGARGAENPETSAVGEIPERSKNVDPNVGSLCPSCPRYYPRPRGEE